MAHPTKALVLVLLLCVPLLPAAAAGGLAAGPSSASDLKDGIDQFRNGQYDKAILLFHNVLLDPSAGGLKADASLLIAKAYMATGRLDDAGQNLDFYIATFPAAPDYPEAVYQKGRLLFMKDDLETSLQVLQGFLSKYPSSSFAPSAWFWAGESLYGLGRLDDARAVYAKIVKDYPTSVKVEAANYKLDLIDIKKKEVELATLLKWSHEELLRTVEDSQNREQTYQQAIDAYQRRLSGAANASLPEDVKTISDLKQQVAQQADLIAQLKSQLAAAAASPSAAGSPSSSPSASSADTDALEKTLQTKAAALALKEQLLGILGAGGRTVTRRPVLLAVAIISVLSSVSIGALELSSGPVKLTLYEGRGRFQLASQAKPGSGSYVPLLAAEDPRTSRLDVVVGNKVYTMGESPEFRETVGSTADGARFVWVSPFLQVTESFRFVTAVGGTITSGVRIDLSLKNLSNQDVAVGVRYLFDTWLGEASFVHFRTDSVTQVTHELTLTPADRAPWWVSPLPSDPATLGFQVMLAGSGITVPDRVVFANWKRLSDSSFGYDTSSVRTFSLLPYSVNDSAAAQYYDPRTVAHGAETVISVVMGRFSAAGLTTTAPAPPVAATPENGTGTAAASTGTQGTASGTAAAASAQRTAAINALARVDALLAELDAAAAAGTPLSDQRIAQIQAQLKDLAAASSVPGSAP